MHRRTFLAKTALGAAGTIGASRLYSPSDAWAAMPGLLPEQLSGRDAATGLDDSVLKQLAAAALDAAARGGATYADVRFTTTRTLGLSTSGAKSTNVSTREFHAVGVRVLVDDAWGFVSGAGLTTDDVVASATDAVAQARLNRWATTKPVTLADRPMVRDGTWATPIVRDPFTVPLDEQFDVMLAANDTVLGKPGLVRIETSMSWYRQKKTFAASDGTYLTQTIYRSSGQGSMIGMTGREQAYGLGFTGAGYEVLLEAKLEEQYPAMLARLNAPPKLSAPTISEVEPGRYDIVVTASLMAQIVDLTVGQALQLDRALGFEANAEGTSYLAPPMEVLGTKLAPDFVTITANRSQARGIATVKWDDEGVETEEFALVKNGVVVDYETTRPQAPWLTEWYARERRPMRSHGDAGAMDAFYGPMQFVPNLVLEPGAGVTTLDDLIGQTEKGILITDLGGLGLPPVMDQQLLNGILIATGVEIVNGKIGKPLTNVGAQFRAPEFWKSVVALGGAVSTEITKQRTIKGEPIQEMGRTISAVPARISQMNVINVGMVTPATQGYEAQ